MKLLVTGSGGLIGGEAVEFFGARGDRIFGIDNNARREYFGPDGDTLWNLNRVAGPLGDRYKHHQADIRSEADLGSVFTEDGGYDAIIHCAAQPSHDKAREIPLVDFDVNARGTLLLLEATRRFCPGAVFIFMSTNKVYGDAPNEMEFAEYETRYDWFPEEWAGFDEETRLDQSQHSLFGCSKAAADLIVQEYGRCFGMRTAVLRGGCLTGPGHSSVELHGFLSFLVKRALDPNGVYRIFGYQGKQVRDNIHSRDVIAAMAAIIADPPAPGSVFNLGGGRANSVSILEALTQVEALIGRKVKTEYVDEPRRGDHICYITDTGKLRQRYPGWGVTVPVATIIADLVGADFQFQVDNAWRGVKA